jgi:hypothetical protein
MNEENAMRPHEDPTRASREPAREQSIDEMVEDTFPASDATQLPGRAAGGPADAGDVQQREHSQKSRESVPGAPRTIGNQGVIPASRMNEETVALGDTGTLTLRYDADVHRLHLYFSDDGLALDAKALDRLIAALSAKRTQMAD